MEPKAKVTAGVGFIAPVLSLKSEIAGFTETQRENGNDSRPDGAGGDGGGIYAFRTTRILNSTISNNRTGGGGGSADCSAIAGSKDSTARFSKRMRSAST